MTTAEQFKNVISEEKQKHQKAIEALDALETLTEEAFSGSGTTATGTVTRKRGRPAGSKNAASKRGPGRPKGSGRGPGRPKGSKSTTSGSKRGPGRPKGSKNKPKPDAAHTEEMATAAAE